MIKTKTNPIKIFLTQVREYLLHNKVLLINIIVSLLLLLLATYISIRESGGFNKFKLYDFEPGRVADRDVVVNKTLSFIDEDATALRKTARMQSVNAVFIRSAEVAAANISLYTELTHFLSELYEKGLSEESFLLAVQERYPAKISNAAVETLFHIEDVDKFLLLSLSLFKQIYSRGVVEFPDKGLENFNKTEITVLSKTNTTQDYAVVAKTELLNKTDIPGFITSIVKNIKLEKYAELFTAFVVPFITPNILYDMNESEKAMDNALKKVEPVMVTIEKGEKIVRSGFIITSENYQRLMAYAKSGNYIDRRVFTAMTLFLCLLYVLAIFLFGKRISPSPLSLSFSLLILYSTALVYVLVLFVSKLSLFSLPLNLIPILPTALITALIAILISERIAVISSIITALAILIAMEFKIEPMLFSLFSGFATISLLHITGQRMDLIKTACSLMIVQPIFTLILMIAFPQSFNDLLFIAGGAAINGFLSGILVLGFLPILETLLNTTTSFRLMELSDLNSPIMKKMLVTVSGTYNHTMMVATLAESACREIGANPLLARVGAYYHDIGKMENGEYFVENQTGDSKHLDLNPRLSATVIRSHLKIGIEKARQMHLPQAVIDIIGEHHGNSIISYFYEKEKAINPDADPEDFTYPGVPPRTKESAVVMLADVVEAACRTLEKPSIPRLEKFIDMLVEKKIQMHQLDNSDLTFKDIKTIKASFVSILAGYYHSRIEYPNQKDPDEKETKPAKKEIVKGSANA
ncbi:7TM receptor with intracellular HD hydrolase [Treponema phagedenis F0421]|uniref:HD family phosphohydrolase n=1 Tax=Treponema phagedenis TaxID=162 RepID=UPI0001F63947|nr:HDIG domain-containing metalloprotein [Treponema phagedenis]EFW36448.1 7TM receptor with intracellular HD hydrolase [Treponema phagedenis F0421]